MNTLLFRRRQGFTLIEILIVVAILGILLGLAMPAFLKSRLHARKQVCIENLAQIESAKQMWGLESGGKNGDSPGISDLIGPDSYIKVEPSCPAGGKYDLTSIGANALCNIEGHTLD